MEVSLKTKNRATIWSSNPIPGQISRKNHHWKRHMYNNVHCFTIYNRTQKKPKCPSTRVLNRFSHVWLYVTLWTVAHQAPLSTAILQARILEWVAIPSSPEDLPDSGIKPTSLMFPTLAGRFFTTRANWVTHPSTEEWIKMWHIHAMEYYSDI